jgi:hypothetical protein
MKKSILEIKREYAKKRNMASSEESLMKYEEKQAEIKKLLKQIEAGLEKHDRDASGNGGHHWGYVGDLSSIADTLTDLRDRLHRTGEYAEVVSTGTVYNRKGNPVKVVVP